TARTERGVGWAVGACLAARTETLRALGPFDERIFLYGEDLELGVRAARTGVPTVFWPHARAIHHAGHAAAKEWGGEPVARVIATRRTALRRERGRAAAALDTAILAATHAQRAALRRLAGRPAEREAAYVRALLRRPRA